MDFQYGKERQLFNKLNLQFERGITALVGQSGCGKTTIISLLMRFYDTSAGAVIFNVKSEGNPKQINIKELELSNLRDIVGYVGQEPVLIGKTLREVLLAEEETDERVYEVLKMVKADGFVREIGLHS